VIVLSVVIYIGDLEDVNYCRFFFYICYISNSEIDVYD